MKKGKATKMIDPQEKRRKTRKEERPRLRQPSRPSASIDTETSIRPDQSPESTPEFPEGRR